jgi:hypothetical protein
MAAAMDIAFAMADKKTFLELPPQGTLTVGRSHKADYRIDGVGVSGIHIEIERGPDPTTITVKDVSLNGTGILAPAADPETATPLHRNSITVQMGTGVLLPHRTPGCTTPRQPADVLWLGQPPEGSPAGRPRHAQGGPPPRASLPSTWPAKWMDLSQSVQHLWMREGIEGPMDLSGTYTSEKDLTEELRKALVPEADVPLAVQFWKSAPRDARLMVATMQPVTKRPPPPSPTAEIQPMVKRRRGPVPLNEPGLWHKQWEEKERLKDKRTAQAQGLQPIQQEHLDEVWAIYLRAGKASAFRKTAEQPDEEVLKTLLLRPIARYADSMPARLAAWRRWEKWTMAQRPADHKAPFKPSELLTGKYLMEIDKNGTTAASQAWAALKWWADRLGLDLALQSPLVQDFRLKVQGHVTEQAEVLPLTLIPHLRDLARERGTRGTFASMLLVIAGACVRFAHVQRSAVVDITEDLIIFKCSKGKKRQQGVREAYRWATPRCWAPGDDTAAKAITLVKDVADKAKGYANAPFLIPDLSTSQGHNIGPGDVWLPRPMPYKKFVALMRTLLADMGSPGPSRGWTFNALRRLMPTGADVLQFSDRVATAIGNWQDTPRGTSDIKRGKMKEQMAKRYAAGKVITAGHYKIKIVAAIWHAEQTSDTPDGADWDKVRTLYPEKKHLQRITKDFSVAEAMKKDTADPGCLPQLPRGPLRHQHGELLREVPELDQITWSMQSLATSAQRPWVHFAPSAGEKPYCRATKFRRDPVRQGRGLVEAASTGERPCPKCVARLGKKAHAVMAEFCMTEKEFCSSDER